MAVFSEFYFPSADGKTLIHVNQWTPLEAPLRGVVQIAHGVAEYGRRYEPFAQFLVKQGYVVAANDHLGHGLSVAEGAPRVFFGEQDGWDHAVADMETLHRRLASLYPNLPYFLFGHSMGSFLTRTLLIRYPGGVKGAVLCGTGQQSPLLLAAGIRIANGEIRRVGAGGFSPRANQLAFGAYNKAFAPARTDYDWISANPDNVDAYLADPFCGEPVTVGLFRDLLGGIRFVGKAANVAKMDRNLSVLFIAGDQDPVGDMGKGVERAFHSFRKAGLSDVSLKLYHGLRHEILNERQRRFVFQDVLDWLNARS